MKKNKCLRCGWIWHSRLFDGTMPKYCPACKSAKWQTKKRKIKGGE